MATALLERQPPSPYRAPNPPLQGTRDEVARLSFFVVALGKARRILQESLCRVRVSHHRIEPWVCGEVAERAANAG